MEPLTISMLVCFTSLCLHRMVSQGRADCSMKMELLINTAFTTKFVLTDLWGMGLLIYAQLISRKNSARGTVLHSFQNHPTRLSCHVGWSWNRLFGVSYNNLPK